MRGLSGMGTLECVDFMTERGCGGAGVQRKIRVKKFERKLSCLLSRPSSLGLSQSFTALESQKALACSEYWREQA